MSLNDSTITIDAALALIGGLDGVHAAPFALKESFLNLARRFCQLEGTVALVSGGQLDCARYDILGVMPWLCVKAFETTCRITLDQAEMVVNATPLALLKRLLAALQLPPGGYPAPLAAGFMGYLAYDLKDGIEKLPRTAIDDLGLPHLCLYAPAVIIVHDRLRRTAWQYIPRRRSAGEGAQAATQAAFNRLCAAPPFELTPFRADAQGLGANFSRLEYEACIARIREYIAAGDLYQVNMSQRFMTDCQGDAFDLFTRLYDLNPAPFFAYIQAGDHQIVSTSPERFIRRENDLVETRPIKGTRPRSDDLEEDARQRAALCQSPKEDAELSMIVDLLRNDLGKVCRAGSVRVAEHKRLEAYRNVYHLVSTVSGALAPETDSADLIRALSPGGSITGCPKIRAMEIIDELEPVRRHIYTGAIGYIGFHETLDLAIAIRTATITGNKMFFSVGGGIVYDSDPSDEYAETLHKGQSLMHAIASSATPFPRSIAWHNGRLRPAGDVAVPLADEALLYGHGFFETIRAQKGLPLMLDLHIARFFRSWRALFPSPPPTLDWSAIISEVLGRNRLADQVAAVKLLATRGTRNQAPFDHQLVVTARPYVHRLSVKKAPGLRLITYPPARLTPLADHKTLNYLFYLQAGRWAAAQGFDEALILNPDHSVSETNSANLLLLEGRTVIRPRSPHVLPGVMAQAVLEWLTHKGWTVEEKAVTVPMLPLADQVWLTNALMGVVPVLSIDHMACHMACAAPSPMARTINAALRIGT